MELLTFLIALPLSFLLPVVLVLSIFPVYVWEWHQGNRLLSLKGRAVFITGCDSGFGRLLAEHLAIQGVTVFAACLTSKGCESLQQWAEPKHNDTQLHKKRVYTVQMDVTNDESVAKAKTFVLQTIRDDEELKRKGLWGIVNNAGIVEGFYFELTSLAIIQKVLDVNFLGAVRVTKEFTPLLREGESGGRIVNVASVAGRYALMGLSAYTSAKFALEGFSDTIRREYRDFGVNVSIIEPAGCKTPMTSQLDATARRCFDSASKDLQELYGKQWFDDLSKQYKLSEGMIEEPQGVVNAMISALSSRYPRARYSGTKAGAMAFVPFSWLQAEIQDFLIFLVPGGYTGLQKPVVAGL